MIYFNRKNPIPNLSDTIDRSMGSCRVGLDPVNLPSACPDEELPVPAMVTVAGDGREWMAVVVELPVSTALTLDR